jgi:hypothetical protein
LDGGTLGQELGVREDVESDSVTGVGFEDDAHGFSGAARDGGFFNDDFGGGGDFGDSTGCRFDVAMYMSGFMSQKVVRMFVNIKREERSPGGKEGLSSHVKLSEDPSLLILTPYPRQTQHPYQTFL